MSTRKIGRVGECPGRYERLVPGTSPRCPSRHQRDAYSGEMYRTQGRSVLHGIIIQELLQGFRGPKQRDRIVDHLGSLPLIVPELVDHINAASLQITCRRKGLQIGTIDALLAQVAISHDLDLLTTDQDFFLIAQYAPLRLLTEA